MPPALRRALPPFRRLLASVHPLTLDKRRIKSSAGICGCGGKGTAVRKSRRAPTGPSWGSAHRLGWLRFSASFWKLLLPETPLSWAHRPRTCTHTCFPPARLAAPAGRERALLTASRSRQQKPQRQASPPARPRVSDVSSSGTGVCPPSPTPGGAVSPAFSRSSRRSSCSPCREASHLQASDSPSGKAAGPGWRVLGGKAVRNAENQGNVPTGPRLAR